MNLITRRLVTVLGTAAALLGAAVATQSARGAAIAAGPDGKLHQAVQKEGDTAKALSRAMRQTSEEDAAAKRNIASLKASVSAQEELLSAERAAAKVSASQPAVNTTTGASGSGDDGGGGDD